MKIRDSADFIKTLEGLDALKGTAIKVKKSLTIRKNRSVFRNLDSHVVN